MIPPNEIRIDDWFSHNKSWSYREKDGPFQWTESDWYAVGECTLFLENVDPIPLTLELLQRCGFILEHVTAYGKPYYYHPAGIFLDFYNKKFSLCYKTGYSIAMPFDSVHKLQNLFFDITGEELPITL